MQFSVICDSEPLTLKIKMALMQLNYDCPDQRCFTLASGARNGRDGDFLVIGMNPNPDAALNALRDINRDLKSAGVEKYIVAVGPPDFRLSARAQPFCAVYLAEDDVEEGLRTSVAHFFESYGGGEPGKVITVLSPSGGSGGSTLAVNLAVLLAKEHESACLFDMKHGAGVCDAFLDIKPKHTLADFCQKIGQIDRGVFERLMEDHPPSKCKLLSPPSKLTDIPIVSPEGVQEALRMARGMFKWVVVDLDRTYSQDQQAVLVESEVVILVVRADFTSIRNMKHTHEHLLALGVEKPRWRLVLNRVGQPKEMTAMQVERALGMKVFKAIPDDAATANTAANNGVPFVLSSPRLPISKAISETARDLVKQLSAPA